MLLDFLVGLSVLKFKIQNLKIIYFYFARATGRAGDVFETDRINDVPKVHVLTRTLCQLDPPVLWLP